MRLSAAASEPASGSLSAKAATARPAVTSGSQRSRCAGVPYAATGCAPRPWRASAVSASVHAYASDSRIRHRSSAPESKSRAEQPVLAERLDEWPVDPAWLTLVRKGAQPRPGEHPQFPAPFQLVRLQRESGHGHPSPLGSDCPTRPDNGRHRCPIANC